MTVSSLKIDTQTSSLFQETCPVTGAVEALAQAPSEARGAIFTRAEVVGLILDLVGYRSASDLGACRALEPSFGGGDFLLEMVDRLAASAKAHGRSLTSLGDAIRAVEIHGETFEATKAAVLTKLITAGVSQKTAQSLADAWLIHGDFLLAPIDGAFDMVVGNPPYLRQEMIPAPLIEAYRARFETIYDRADLYIPFFERSLRLLADQGRLGFICADRWTKNRYGAPLRRFISEGYSLDVHIDMTGVEAFHNDVVAYPAITVISKNSDDGLTKITHAPDFAEDNLKQLTPALLGDGAHQAVQSRCGVVSGAAPWILETSRELELVAVLEERFPSLEDAGCRVGIGVATGADKVFIGPYNDLDVEDERKLPLVMTRDIVSGEVEWRGLGIVNPFEADGALADLDAYPRFAAYLEAHRDAITKRHVAKKSPRRWYRTIDRIYPELTFQPKLLVPDIKGDAQIVFEDGKLYPHHNLYFITSDHWDLKALQKVLTAGIARLFVAAYSTRMRGGYLRFQAQYLRRIRIPAWQGVSGALRAALVSDDVDASSAAVAELYGLDADEFDMVSGVKINAA